MERAVDAHIPFFKRFSIRTFAALISLSILSVMLTVTSLYFFSSAIMRKNVSQRNLQIARRASEEISLYIGDALNYLASLAEMLMPIQDPWKADIILENILVTYRKFSALHLVDQYAVTASSELDNDRASLDQNFIARVLGDRSIRYSPVILSQDDLPYMCVIAPGSSSGGLWPIIYADLELRDIWNLVDDISFGESGEAFLLSYRNVLIAHPDKTKVLSVDRSRLVDSIPADPGEGGSYFIAEDESGTRFLAAAVEVPTVGWRLVIVQLLTEAFVPIRTIFAYSGIIAAVALLAAICASMLLVRRYSNPLSRLMYGTEMIREGKLHHRIEIETDDEFGRLSSSFNTMVKDLEDRSEKLAISERQYRLLTENVNDIIFSLDENGEILYCNNQVKPVTGFTVEELTFKNINAFISNRDRDVADRILARGDVNVEAEVEFRRKTGDFVFLEAKIVRSIDPEYGAIYYGVARDISERKKAEAQLKSYQNELRSLASDLIVTEAREREKIASLIHDRIGQALSLCRIKLGILNSRSLQVEEAKVVGEMIPLIEEIIQETRTLIFTISSPLLHDLGLSAALDQLVEQFHNEHPIAFRYDGPERMPTMDTDVSLLLFDAVKELMMNAVKHSQAEQVTVSMDADNEGVTITVEDDGKGFVAASPETRGKNGGGYGLFSIRERLSNLGGRCTVSTGSVRGVAITLRAPIEGGV